MTRRENIYISLLKYIDENKSFILDGFAYWRPQTRYLVKNFDFYFHTNMGWGGYYDGFYLVNKDLSITFDTSNGSYDRNFSMIYNIINK